MPGTIYEKIRLGVFYSFTLAVVARRRSFKWQTIKQHCGGKRVEGGHTPKKAMWSRVQCLVGSSGEEVWADRRRGEQSIKIATTSFS